MSDDVVVPPTGSSGTANPAVATDEISSRHHQLVKVEFGVADSATMVSASNPLPVVQTGTPGLPTGAATQTTLAAVLSALGTPAQAGGLTDTQLRATAVPVSGTVTASGPLTDTQLRATAVPVSGTVTATTGGLTDTQLRATAVPVSGTVTANLGTIAGAATAAKQPALGTAGSASTDVLTVQGNPSGTPIPVSGSFSGLTDLTATGNITGSGQQVSITGMSGMAVCEIQSTGTYSTLVANIEGTVDGTTWVALSGGIRNGLDVTSTFNLSTFSAVSGTVVRQVSVSGFSGIRLNSTGLTSGTAVVTLRASATYAGGLIRSVTNVDTLNGNTIQAGNGTSGTGTARVTIASDSTGQVALAAGTTVGITSVTTPTAGGYSVTRFLAAGSTNTGFSKATPGQIYGWYLANAAAYPVFLKLYDKASAPTLASDTPIMTIPVPAGGGANVEFSRGIACATGIAYAATKLVADTDTTVLVANDLVVNLMWK